MDYWAAATSEIFPGLFIGNSQNTYTREVLESNKINVVVSVIDGRHNLWKRANFADSVKPGHHLWVDCLDNKCKDVLISMRTVCDFIDANLGPKDLKPPGRVLVHCHWGISRSSTMVLAYLMCKLGKSRDELLAEVKTKWPRARPSSNFMAQLEIWEKVEYDVWADEAKTVPKVEYALYLTQRAAYLTERGLAGEEGKNIMDIRDL
ncbi:hypothetical protein V490_09439 [Pseudogymnoascus sp. VKM F-3557]|nr:hypothetical protein V490_09439 [Pseudogymnoascus sp. VKM F-3557]